MSSLYFTFSCILAVVFTNFLPETSTTEINRNYQVVFSGKSQITIHGNTNVSRFQYKYTQSLHPQIFSLQDTRISQGVYFSDAAITLQAASFKAGQPQMDRDFQTLLQAEQHPAITILLKKAEATHFSFEPGSSAIVQADIEITLAGVTNPYKIPVSVSVHENGYLFTGTLALDICEFGLEAPKVMMGLVTIKDNVAIKFNLAASIAPAS